VALDLAIPFSGHIPRLCKVIRRRVRKWTDRRRASPQQPQRRKAQRSIVGAYRAI